MGNMSPRREAARPSPDRATRSPRRLDPPPISQERIEGIILHSLRTGPKTAGELSFHYLPGRVRAARRDEVLEGLLKRGLIALDLVDEQTLYHRFGKMRVYRLAGGGEP
jgi:hypothetical protein